MEYAHPKYLQSLNKIQCNSLRGAAFTKHRTEGLTHWHNDWLTDGSKTYPSHLLCDVSLWKWSTKYKSKFIFNDVHHIYLRWYIPLIVSISSFPMKKFIQLRKVMNSILNIIFWISKDFSKYKYMYTNVLYTVNVYCLNQTNI